MLVVLRYAPVWYGFLCGPIRRVLYVTILCGTRKIQVLFMDGCHSISAACAKHQLLVRKLCHNVQRNWVFTLNNYSEDDVTAMTGFLDEHDLVKYICAGREVGAEGTPHLQGFLVCRNPVRLTTVRTFWDGRAHWEIARGSATQAITYCEKDGDFMEFGVRPLTQAEKGDKNKRRYEEAWESAVEGRMDDIDADLRIPPLLYAEAYLL